MLSSWPFFPLCWPIAPTYPCKTRVLSKPKSPLGSPRNNLGRMAWWWAGLLLLLSSTLLVASCCFLLVFVASGYFREAAPTAKVPLGSQSCRRCAEGAFVFISPKHCTKHSTEREKRFLQPSHTWPSRSGDGTAVYPKSPNPYIRSSFNCHLTLQNTGIRPSP